MEDALAVGAWEGRKRGRETIPCILGWLAVALFSLVLPETGHVPSLQLCQRGDAVRPVRDTDDTGFGLSLSPPQGL